MKITDRKTLKGEKVSAPKVVTATAKVAPAIGSGPASRTAPTHEEIARRSYELYLERGAVDGFALDDWMRAEADLKAR